MIQLIFLGLNQYIKKNGSVAKSGSLSLRVPKGQGQGIGSQIIRILVNKCERHDIRRVHLIAAKGSEAFYNHLGFVARPYDSSGMVLRKSRLRPE